MTRAWERTFALDDIEVGRSGDGRTVTAYAAVFSVAAEIYDAHGHYREVIARTAFDRVLAEGIENVGVLLNHGLDDAGKPSGMGAVPIGVPLEIKPDGKGLLTVTRYNAGARADRILDEIRDGRITGQSFRGKVVASTPAGRAPQRQPGQPLPTITRTELGLTDYGPTRSPAYKDAKILAVRSGREVWSPAIAEQLEPRPRRSFAADVARGLYDGPAERHRLMLARDGRGEEYTRVKRVIAGAFDDPMIWRQLDAAQRTEVERIRREIAEAPARWTA